MMKFVHRNLGRFTILETAPTIKSLSKIALLPVVCALLALPHSACADTNQVGVITATYSAAASGSSDIEQNKGDYDWMNDQDQISISLSGSVQYAVVQNGTNFVLGGQLSEGPDNSVTVSGTGSADVAYGYVCYASWTYYQEGGGLEIYTPSYSGDGWAYCFVNVGLDMSGSTACGGFNTLGWSDAGGLMEELVLEFSVANPSLPWNESLSRTLTNQESWSGFSGGADASATVAITLSYAPSQLTVPYTVNPTSGTAPLTVAFNCDTHDSGENIITNLTWNFGDGQTDTRHVSLSHCYTNAGDFTVSLVCTNADGLNVRGAGPATVHVAQPTFTASPTNGPAPLAVSFACPTANNGGSPVTQWDWDFGDGTGGEEQNPTHTYTNVNNYEVTLTVMNDNDDAAGAAGPATISVESPTIQFTAEPAIGPVPLTVLFSTSNMDNAGHIITAWNWDFNDGSKGTGQTLSHTYQEAGTYSPSLSAINSMDDTVDGSGNGVIVASRSGLVINGDFETGNFYAWSNNDSSLYYSSVPGGSSYAYSGDYGADLSAAYGSTGQLSQPLATIPGSSYLLSFWLNNLTTMPGNPFSVSWGGTTIWNETNIAATGWTNVQLIVTAASTNTILQFGFSGITPFGLDDVDVESRYVQFTANPVGGAAPLPVNFTSPAADNNGQTITAWHWSFGDGSTGAGRTPSHTYTSGGTFNVTLTATNANGNTIVGFGPTINVSVPTLQFSANPAAGGVPLTVQFNSPNQDSGGNAIAARLWNFGDGSTSTTQNPTHIYSQAGLFAPKLVATNTQSVVIVATGPTVTVAAREGLVVNGGFETGDFTGWTTAGDFEDCFVVRNAPAFTHAGTWGAYLAPGGALAYLSQTITTTPGAGYWLSLWLNNTYGSTSNEFLVSWNGGVLFDRTNMSAFGWSNLLFNVTASGTNTALQLGFDNHGDFGVDDISLMPVVSQPPAPTLLVAAKSGPAVAVSGGGADGAVINVLTNNVLAANFTNDASGGYSGSITLPDGVYAMSATETVSGMTSAPSATNSVTVVTVPAPVILFPPNGLTTNNGSLAVTGTGVSGATVSVFDGANLLGAATVNSSGKFSRAVKLSDGPHPLTASETSGGISSAAGAPVAVTLILKPVITAQPQSLAGFLKETAAFSAGAYGAAPLRYVWQKNGTNIPGATATNLTLAGLVNKSAASYRMIASNSYGSVTSSNAVLTLEPNPFTNLTGTYYGLFAESPARFESSGFFKLTLHSLGSFSGSILNAGGSRNFSGAFSIAGQARVAAAPLTITMNLDLSTNDTGQILGVVSNAAWSAPLQAGLGAFGAANKFPAPGKFTMAFENTNDGGVSPGGDGYGTVGINAAGMVSWKGVLADNTGVAPSAVGISQFGRWPLYVPLYGKLGSISGWVTNNFSGGGALEGEAEWFRVGTYGKLYRDGFTNAALPILGSAFAPGTAKIPVLEPTNLFLTLSGGGLEAPLTNNLTLYDTGKFKTNGGDAPKLSLSVTPGTGVISGSFLDPRTRQTSAIKGVVLQQQGDARGFFLGTNATGNFLLTH